MTEFAPRAEYDSKAVLREITALSTRLLSIVDSTDQETYLATFWDANFEPDLPDPNSACIVLARTVQMLRHQYSIKEAYMDEVTLPTVQQDGSVAKMVVFPDRQFVPVASTFQEGYYDFTPLVTIAVMPDVSSPATDWSTYYMARDLRLAFTHGEDANRLLLRKDNCPFLGAYGESDLHVRPISPSVIVGHEEASYIYHGILDHITTTAFPDI